MFSTLKKYISENLQSEVTNAGLNNYEIFGKEIESPISNLIELYLNNKNIHFRSNRAKNKNEFPDLEIIINDIKYAFEHKAGESGAGPNNDMGTLNFYPDKIEKYGDNIYCVFINYSKANENNGIVTNFVYFDKIYKFIGKTAAIEGVLKYRLKDGNLRPKVWSDFSNNTVYFNTLDEFNNAIQKTLQYRAEKLVMQHVNSLNTEGLERMRNYVDERLRGE